MGTIIHTCRDTISIVAVALNAPERLAMANDLKERVEPEKLNRSGCLLDSYARWIAVLPIAVKIFLRNHMDGTSKGWDDVEMETHRLKELNYILSTDDAQMLMTAKHPVIFVLNRLREIAYDICFAVDPNLKANSYFLINRSLDTISGAFGAMEKISTTPLPFVYVAYLRTFLLAYLVFFNMYICAHYGWQGLVILLAVNWQVNLILVQILCFAANLPIFLLDSTSLQGDAWN